MRLWTVFLKTWREMARDWRALGLTLAFSALYFGIGVWLFQRMRLEGSA